LRSRNRHYEKTLSYQNGYATKSCAKEIGLVLEFRAREQSVPKGIFAGERRADEIGQTEESRMSEKRIFEETHAAENGWTREGHAIETSHSEKAASSNLAIPRKVAPAKSA
jgi:hypothetical protein